MKYKNIVWLFFIIVIVMTTIFFTGCKKNEEPAVTVGKTETESDLGDESISPVINEIVTDLIEPETKPDPLTEPVPITEVLEETAVTETQKTELPVKPAETEIPDVKAVRLTSNYINTLTGLSASKADYYKRPVAIMINNIKKSCPQIGISQADVIYECLVEGGMTRLLMFMINYENASEIGSVRSSREYYLDFAANHNAIFIHAGGSNTAYEEIRDRKINNLDGVNMYIPDMFYRDEWRKVNMGYEHSLMTTGPKITAGIKYKKYSTEIKDTFIPSFNFVDYNGGKNEMTGGNEARHVIITYNNSHFPQYIYISKTGTYKRYQFNGIAHMDGANDTQLEFTNVLILNLQHYYTGNSYGHVNVDSVGTGKGYYVSGGKYIQITWTKKSKDTPMILTNTDGSLLMMNCGKTFVNIVNDSAWSSLNLNYKKS